MATHSANGILSRNDTLSPLLVAHPKCEVHTRNYVEKVTRGLRRTCRALWAVGRKRKPILTKNGARTGKQTTYPNKQ